MGATVLIVITIFEGLQEPNYALIALCWESMSKIKVRAKSKWDGYKFFPVSEGIVLCTDLVEECRKSCVHKDKDSQGGFEKAVLQICPWSIGSVL